jgi:hypothetical protein
MLLCPHFQQEGATLVHPCCSPHQPHVHPRFQSHMHSMHGHTLDSTSVANPGASSDSTSVWNSYCYFRLNSNLRPLSLNNSVDTHCFDLRLAITTWVLTLHTLEPLPPCGSELAHILDSRATLLLQTCLHSRSRVWADPWATLPWETQPQLWQTHWQPRPGASVTLYMPMLQNLTLQPIFNHSASAHT